MPASAGANGSALFVDEIFILETDRHALAERGRRELFDQGHLSPDDELQILILGQTGWKVHDHPQLGARPDGSGQAEGRPLVAYVKKRGFYVD